MIVKNYNQFKDFYQVDAENFSQPVEKPSLPILLLKATGIFLTITIIVFGITNYQFILAQISDWREGRKYMDEFNGDVDGDGLPDWWEKQYQLNSSQDDASLDNDNDGANNLLEFQFGTNPFKADTDNDGYLDGEEIKNGYNPNGQGRLDTDGDGIYDWWEVSNGLNKNDPTDSELDWDNDGLNNREEFIYKTDPLKFDTDKDGVSDGDEVEDGQNPTGRGPLLVKEADWDDVDGDGFDLVMENLFGTDPNNPDTDGDGFNDYREASRGYDPTGGFLIDATLKIPAIGVVAPVIWVHETDEKKILHSLENGIIHYPGTPIPGMKGNSYITGHSSYYTWSKSSFKEVLKDINKLKVGDEIIFTYKLTNGKNIDIVYEVREPGIVVLPDDERLFAEYEGYELTLVTCWPLGTNLKRMMVKADLKRPHLK